jgi:hypothetical protein
MFIVGDRVQLRAPTASGGPEPAGTVVGFVTPWFASSVGAPDDVLVRWDTGLEIAVAPAQLVPVPASLL